MTQRSRVQHPSPKTATPVSVDTQLVSIIAIELVSVRVVAVSASDLVSASPVLWTGSRRRLGWVYLMTGLDRSPGTVVVRMTDSVRGNAVELSKATASDAVPRLRSPGGVPASSLDTTDPFDAGAALMRRPVEAAHRFSDAAVALGGLDSAREVRAVRVQGARQLGDRYARVGAVPAAQQREPGESELE